MKHGSGLYLLAVLMVGATVLLSAVDGAEGRPAMEEVADMAEALRYLQQLDKFYAPIARPRFGRSAHPVSSPIVPNNVNLGHLMGSHERR